jgi:DNA-binding transcriptional LysR family regulator
MRQTHNWLVNMDELRWFLTLAETEHVTAAASGLYLTQPTLSRALARLEHELGTALFDRDGRRLRLNQYGQILREHATRALAEVVVASLREGYADLAVPPGHRLAGRRRVPLSAVAAEPFIVLRADTGLRRLSPSATMSRGGTRPPLPLVDSPIRSCVRGGRRS